MGSTQSTWGIEIKIRMKKAYFWMAHS